MEFKGTYFALEWIAYYLLNPLALRISSVLMEYRVKHCILCNSAFPVFKNSVLRIHMHPSVDV